MKRNKVTFLIFSLLVLTTFIVYFCTDFSVMLAYTNIILVPINIFIVKTYLRMKKLNKLNKDAKAIKFKNNILPYIMLILEVSFVYLIVMMTIQNVLVEDQLINFAHWNTGMWYTQFPVFFYQVNVNLVAWTLVITILMFVINIITVMLTIYIARMFNNKFVFFVNKTKDNIDDMFYEKDNEKFIVVSENESLNKTKEYQLYREVEYNYHSKDILITNQIMVNPPHTFSFN